VTKNLFYVPYVTAVLYDGLVLFIDSTSFAAANFKPKVFGADVSWKHTHREQTVNNP
jgi:hypothetical protein